MKTVWSARDVFREVHGAEIKARTKAALPEGHKKEVWLKKWNEIEKAWWEEEDEDEWEEKADEWSARGVDKEHKAL